MRQTLQNVIWNPTAKYLSSVSLWKYGFTVKVQVYKSLEKTLPVNLVSKAMRSVNIIEYSIKNRVKTNFLQKFSSDYDAIISVYSNIAKMANVEAKKQTFKGLKRTFWG